MGERTSPGNCATDALRRRFLRFLACELILGLGFFEALTLRKSRTVRLIWSCEATTYAAVSVFSSPARKVICWIGFLADSKASLSRRRIAALEWMSVCV